MKWLTNEAMFYGGLATMLVSLVITFIYFFFSQCERKRLNTRLDAEYGKSSTDKRG